MSIRKPHTDASQGMMGERGHERTGETLGKRLSGDGGRGEQRWGELTITMDIGRSFIGMY